MLTTLSGDEVVELRDELELIKDSFSLVEFDDEDMDENKGELALLEDCSFTSSRTDSK